jgi:hypothetical protein
MAFWAALARDSMAQERQFHLAQNDAQVAELRGALYNLSVASPLASHLWTPCFTKDHNFAFAHIDLHCFC